MALVDVDWASIATKRMLIIENMAQAGRTIHSHCYFWRLTLTSGGNGLDQLSLGIFISSRIAVEQMA